MLMRLLLAVFCCSVLLCSPAYSSGSEESEIRQLRALGIEQSSRGMINEGLASFESAIRLAERAYGSDSTYVAGICFDAGLAALKTDQYQKAKECLERAVKLNPNAVEPRIKLAEFYKKRGMMQSAKEQLARVISRHPDNLEARQILAMTYQQEGKFLQANRECAYLSSIALHREAADARMALAAPMPVPPVPATAAPPEVKPAEAPPAVSPIISSLRPGTAKPAVAPPPKPAPVAKKAEPPKPAPKPAPQKKAGKPEPKKPEPKKGKRGEQVMTAEGGPQSSWGLQPRLKSKAVLLTPVGKKGKTAAASEGGGEAAKPAETPKPVEAAKPEPKPVAKKPAPQSSIASEEEGGEEEGFGGSSARTKAKPAEAAKPAPKPQPVVVKVEPAKRPKGGLVPPPPPVVPQFGMPMMMPAPQPVAAPKPKPKPVETPAASKPAEHHESEDPDFLLDWAGKKKGK
jgi:hypothetical protein